MTRLVEADVFFAPSNALGSSLQALGTQQLAQTGPGHYRTCFRPRNPGVYLVRARHGAQMVSAGEVFNPSAEAATGQVNKTVLKKSAELTRGSFVAVDGPRRVMLRGRKSPDTWNCGPGHWGSSSPSALPNPHPPLGTCLRPGPIALGPRRRFGIRRVRVGAC